MAYALAASQPLDEDVRRIACGELKKSIENLRETEGDADERVHDTRKSLKKLRALLRMLRSELGEATYQRENHCFRDAGRRLANARDAAARLESFERLIAHYSLHRPDFEITHQRLLELSQSEARGPVTASATALDHELLLALARVTGWPIERPDWRAISWGISHSYKCGRRAFRTAYTRPSDGNFHEWRKRVKDHLYQMRILCNVWLEGLQGRRAGLEKLADMLGEDHDLSELRRVLFEQRENIAEPAQLDELLRLIATRSGELRDQARFLGERIYAERPKEFAVRLRAYYEAWRAEASARVLPAPDAAELEAPQSGETIDDGLRELLGS